MVNDATVLPRPMEHYILKCPDDTPIAHEGFAPQVKSSFLGALLSSAPHFLRCNASGVGIKPHLTIENHTAEPVLESDNDVHTLKQHFSAVAASGFSIEIWVTTIDNESTHQEHVSRPQQLSRPIAAFARKGTSVFPWFREPLGCEAFDLIVSQKGSFLDFVYAVDDLSQHCRHLSVAIETSFAPIFMHVVFSLGKSSTDLFINGKVILQGTQTNFFDKPLQTWSPNYTLQLLPGSTPFRGTIQAVALYDTPISERQAKDKFIAGQEQTLHSTPLLAIPSRQYALMQGRSNETNIWIGGSGVASGDSIGAIEFLSLPRHGDVLPSEGTRTISIGSLLDLDINTWRLPIRYSTFSPDYFNAPNQSANGMDLNTPLDSFDFRVVIIHPATREILTSSAPVSQMIRVLNINHRPTLTAPTRITLDGSVESEYGKSFAIDGIKLTDRDRNVDRIRIDILAQNGTLSLNQRYRHLADFKSCRNRTYAQWECHGSGASDRSMTFLAVPGDVNLVLGGLNYRTFSGIVTDEIIVRAFDGKDGGCLTETELPSFLDENGNSYASIRSGCLQVQSRIAIEISSRDRQREASFRVVSLFVLVAIGFVLLCVGLCLKSFLAKRFCKSNAQTTTEGAIHEFTF